MPQTENALGRGNTDFLLQGCLIEQTVGPQRRFVFAVRAKSGPTRLERAQRLLHRFFEGAPDGHGLAHTLHLRSQNGIGLGKLFEGEARHLDHAVVDGRFETRRRLPRDVVAQFVKRVSHRELGCDFGDGKSCGFRGQRGRTRHARVHLDDHHAPGLWIDRELDVRASGFHAYSAYHREGRVAHRLVFLVGQCLDRGHRDRVTRVHSHWVEVLDGTNDHAIVRTVPHDLDLEFFPAEQRLFNQHFAHR